MSQPEDVLTFMIQVEFSSVPVARSPRTVLRTFIITSHHVHLPHLLYCTQWRVLQHKNTTSNSTLNDPKYFCNSRGLNSSIFYLFNKTYRDVQKPVPSST